MKLDPALLADPHLLRIFGLIKQAGGEARLVGGYVRDALLGRGLGDYDLATTLLPEAVMAACAPEFKVIPTGIKHGTVTVVAGHQPFEITTLRRDVNTDGRHAEVEYTDSWQQDAARRDFTMNALFCDADGNVTDFFDGEADIKAGCVRFVGLPEQRIREDVLRILRFFRFHAHYGHGAPDAAGLSACKALVALLPTLSAERVRSELLKLLAAPNPVPTWQLMMDIGVFKALTLPLENIIRLEAVVKSEASLFSTSSQRKLGSPNIEKDPSFRWDDAVLLEGAPLRRLWAVNEGDITSLASQLRLSNAEALRLKALTPLPAVPQEGAQQFQLAYRLGVQAVVNALIVSGQAQASQIEALQNWQRPHMPLNGADLAKLGIPSGPRMGEILSAVENWWVEQNFAPDHAACVAKAKTLI